MKKVMFLLSFLVLPLLLVACADGAKKEEKPEPEPEPLTKEVYQEKSIALSTDHYNLTMELSEYRAGLQTVGEVELEWLHEKFNELEEKGDELVSLVPPKEYEDVHSHFNTFIEEFNKYLDGFRNDLESQNTGLGMDYIDNVQVAQDNYNYARKIIALDYPYTVGNDGTITTDDVKDLDLAAGMDRDSVLLNVSKDGKELVGTWGFYDQNDEFNVVFELHENGQYDGYGNGEYPNKDQNYIKGEWEYNYLTQVIEITQTFGLNDGKEFEPAALRNVDLQSFKDGNMRIMDVNSYTTWELEKYSEDKTKDGVSDENYGNTKESEKVSDKKPNKKSENSVAKESVIGFWVHGSGLDSQSISLKEGGLATVYGSETAFGEWSMKNDTIYFQTEDGSLKREFRVVKVTNHKLTLEEEGKETTYDLQQ